MNRIDKITLSILIALTASVILIACGNGSPEKLIIGKWEWEDVSGNYIEFFEDGTSTGSIFGPEPVPGTYEWVDETQLEITWDLADIKDSVISMPMELVFEVTELTEDILVMTMQGNVYTYNRVGN